MHYRRRAIDGSIWRCVRACRLDRVTSEVAFGEAALEIIAAAERLGAGLIVMGRRGSGAVRRAVLGSVDDAVLRHAPCPVLVVGDGEA